MKIVTIGAITGTLYEPDAYVYPADVEIKVENGKRTAIMKCFHMPEELYKGLLQDEEFRRSGFRKTSIEEIFKRIDPEV